MNELSRLRIRERNYKEREISARQRNKEREISTRQRKEGFIDSEEDSKRA